MPSATPTFPAYEICAYPLSPQYGPIIRYLIYPLLLCQFLSPIVPWLRTGPLKTIFTYCAIAAVHQTAMAYNHSTKVLDLDVFPALHVCVIAMLLGPWAVWMLLVFGNSDAAKRRTKIRVASGNRGKVVVFGLFLVLIWSGIVSFAAAAKFHPMSLPATTDFNKNNTASTSRCQGLSLPMRSTQEPSEDLLPYAGLIHSRHNTGIIVTTVLVTIYAIIGFSTAASARRTYIAPRGNVSNIIIINNNKDLPDSNNEIMDSSAKILPSSLSSKVFLITPPFLILTWSIFAELCVLRGLPYSEGKDAVGQWGPLVAVGLVLGAEWVAGRANEVEEEESVC
ncbi:MAG: hypothetical protein MMC33_005232 [Icmadophila ericetorum]|nr:hypothetical protein [Icmadophila ericetorum]